jgi:hypothetical protein
MSVGFGSDVDENEEIQLNLSELQLTEIRLAFTEVSMQIANACHDHSLVHSIFSCYSSQSILAIKMALG